MARSYALAALASAAISAVSAQQLGITMTVPPSGSAAAITGTITGATSALKHGQFKVAVLTSGDNGATWWDKSHGPYRNHQLADPGYDAGDAQNAGVVITNTWTWKLANYQASPNDATSDTWVAFVVPQSYDMSYPQYQIEGTAIRGDLQAASIGWVLVSKTKGTLASGSGAFTGVPGGNAQPAATTAAEPAASPAAAAPSTAALPASSGAPTATTLGNSTTASSGAATAVTSALGAVAAAVAVYVLA